MDQEKRAGVAGTGVKVKPLRAMGLQSSIIYGPVRSRRLGNSLGINPLPLSVKVCSYDCLYCQYGLERPVGKGESLPDTLFPRVEVILRELEAAVRACPGKIDSLTFSGNGEPTLHPGFCDLVSGTVAIRDRLLPEARVALLSNGATVLDEKIRAAIRLVDDPILKLDAGDEASWRVIDRPGKGIDMESIVSAMANLDDIIIQSLFFEGDGGRIKGNTSDEVIERWLGCVERIRPRHVQIYTLDRVPAIPTLRRATEETLHSIRSALERRGISGHVYR